MNSTTIFVGNIQSIKDEQLREYFERFGKIEAFYHNCTRAVDEWLIDYRFIRFSSDTDMTAFLTNKIDHTICRIRLDIHSYEAAFRDDTRLILDRKICIAHTDPKLDRNVIKKSFSRYGRVLNCTCVSTGNGVEHVYIEFDTVNAVQSVFSKDQRHFAGRAPLAVKRPFRPSQIGVKMEPISNNERESSSRQRLNSNVDTAQYSSFLVNQPSNSHQEDTRRTSNPLSESRSERLSTNTKQSHSQSQSKEYEDEYNLIIRQDFEEITYQIDKFLQNQRKSYRKIRQFILNELRSPSSSSSSDDGEIESSSSSSSPSDSENLRSKRLKSHH